MKRLGFTIGKTRLTVHPAVLLTVAYVVLTGHGRLLCVGMVSILLHEIGHACAAKLCGTSPQELELTPLGCLLRLDEEALMPRGKRALMVLAGPCMTGLLAWLSVRLTGCGWLDQSLGRMAFGCNAALLLVNLLPALPLDGGRLLALLLSRRLTEDTVRRVMRTLGTAVGTLLVAVNAAVCWRYGGWNLSLGCAGCFLIYASGVGTVTAAMEQLQRLMDRKSELELKGCLPVYGMAVVGSMTLQEAVKQLRPGRYTVFTVVEIGTMRVLGRLDETRLIAAFLAAPGERMASLIKGETG